MKSKNEHCEQRCLRFFKKQSIRSVSIRREKIALSHKGLLLILKTSLGSLFSSYEGLENLFLASYQSSI